MSSNDEKDREPTHYVLKAQSGSYRVTLNLVTSVSTSANASFEKLVGVSGCSGVTVAGLQNRLRTRQLGEGD